jgi:preprotein translocase subunit SecG
MLFTFLLVVHFIIALLLVVVILMQKSEGGGITSGGSPSGLMSARGAADFLTRSTSILAGLFIVMSIGLAVLAANRHSTTIDASQQRAAAAAATPAPVTNQTGAVPFNPGNSSGATDTAGNAVVPPGQ